jgi:hypothetical protein
MTGDASKTMTQYTVGFISLHATLDFFGQWRDILRSADRYTTNTEESIQLYVGKSSSRHAIALPSHPSPNCITRAQLFDSAGCFVEMKNNCLKS